MVTVRTLTLACALALGVQSTLHAQDAACPAANRLTLHSIGGAPVPNLLDGARYIIVLGRVTNIQGSPALAALVARNGVCLPPMWVNHVAGQVGALQNDTNLCLGGGADTVHVLYATTSVNICGTSATMNAFAYGGRRLAIYGGGGGDVITGGSGKDHIYGGAGSDLIGGHSGSEDELYGESDQDTLIGSSGSATWSSGGTNGDMVVDVQGANDTLSGNSGNDHLTSRCNSSFMFCGSGLDDYAESPDPEPPGSLCEEWDQDLSC